MSHCSYNVHGTGQFSILLSVSENARGFLLALIMIFAVSKYSIQHFTLKGPYGCVHCSLHICARFIPVLVEGYILVYTQCQHCIKVCSGAKLPVLKRADS